MSEMPPLVTVTLPPVPRLQTPAPTTPTIAVVPVMGPPGPTGPLAQVPLGDVDLPDLNLIFENGLI